MEINSNSNLFSRIAPTHGGFQWEYPFPQQIYFQGLLAGLGRVTSMYGILTKHENHKSSSIHVGKYNSLMDGTVIGTRTC